MFFVPIFSFEKQIMIQARLINLDNLRTISGNDPAFMTAILNKIVQALPEGLKGIRENIASQNWQGVASLAHKTKSTSAYTGSADLHTLLGSIEMKAKSGQSLETIPALHTEANQLSDSIVVELKDVLLGMG